MAYATPELLLVGQASGVVLGAPIFAPLDTGTGSDPSLTSDTEW
jgi:hypothetical protein